MAKTTFTVVDNAFNRHWYPTIIGLQFDNPPAYANVIEDTVNLSAMEHYKQTMNKETASMVS